MRIDGLILAGGLSTRAPGFKMTLPLGGETVLDKAIQGMRPFTNRIVVVAGYQAHWILPICQAYENVKMVINENYKAGMFSSVKCGMGLMNCDRFFVLPGDMPLIVGQTYQALLRESGEVVIPSFHGHGGHPILLGQQCIEPCLKTPTFLTLRDFIDTQEIHYSLVEDPGILMDIDTPEDYKRIKRRWHDENNRSSGAG